MRLPQFSDSFKVARPLLKCWKKYSDLAKISFGEKLNAFSDLIPALEAESNGQLLIQKTT